MEGSTSQSSVEAKKNKKKEGCVDDAAAIACQPTGSLKHTSAPLRVQKNERAMTSRERAMISREHLHVRAGEARFDKRRAMMRVLRAMVWLRETSHG